ncbi:MAG: LamG domain-containing protein [Candidatus Omnitrophica bacterium]|nr:LamG domain-containing protein [Candidatus Omnitrophota bacterium]
MNRRGFALATVLLIIVVVPIAVFSITFFITSSVTRYETQTRSLRALYLAQAGLQRSFFNIESTGTPLPVADWDAANRISVTLVAQCPGVYQLRSTGTSLESGDSVSRTLFAQYDAAANRVTLYLESDGTGIPPPVCCDQFAWPFSEGVGFLTGTVPYQGVLTPSNANGPAWVAGRVGTALRFNQAAVHNYVTVPDAAGLDLSSQGTTMAWIYFTAQVTNNTGILHKGNLSNENDEAYGLVITRVGANRRVSMVLRDEGGVRRVLTPNRNLALNAWHHVAGMWGPSGVSVYIDGELARNNSTVYTARSTAGALLIGTRAANNATTRFVGVIDEVYVYACERTAQEVLDYYNATRP